VIHRYVFHNDRLLEIEQVRLSPGQAGLLCGWDYSRRCAFFRAKLSPTNVTGAASKKTPAGPASLFRSIQGKCGGI